MIFLILLTGFCCSTTGYAGWQIGYEESVSCLYQVVLKRFKTSILNYPKKQLPPQEKVTDNKYNFLNYHHIKLENMPP